MTEYLEIDLHNFKQVSQSVRMELIARNEAYVQWENGFIQPVNRYLNLHISPDTTISYKVLFAIPSDGRFGDFEVNLYPNPFVDQLNYVISWNAIKTQRGRIDILDLNGQEVYRQAIQIQTGENTIVGNWKMTAIDKVNQGLYVFRVLEGNEVLLTQKIVKH
jgi:hypothetical protein